jgi:hypothetical protein
MTDEYCKQLGKDSESGKIMSSEEFSEQFVYGGCVGCAYTEDCDMIEAGPLERWLFYEHDETRHAEFEEKYIQYRDSLDNEIDKMVLNVRKFAKQWAISVYDGKSDELDKFVEYIAKHAIYDLEYELEQNNRLFEIKDTISKDASNTVDYIERECSQD